MLDYHPSIYMKDDKLYAWNTTDSESLHNALLKATNYPHDDNNALHTALGIHHPDCETPLPMMVMPVGEAGLNIFSDVTHAHTAVMFSDPERNQPIVPEALQTAYKLTPSEAQVAIAITNGLSMEEIATMHGNKASTVKSQLLSVYRKLGINRQSELVKILLTGPFRVNFDTTVR